MSKKLFLKRTYAKIVSGEVTKDCDEVTKGCDQVTMDSDEGLTGESVIPTKWRCFSYYVRSVSSYSAVRDDNALKPVQIFVYRMNEMCLIIINDKKFEIYKLPLPIKTYIY